MGDEKEKLKAEVVGWLLLSLVVTSRNQALVFSDGRASWRRPVGGDMGEDGGGWG